jgi:membrane-bound ClpP family serine protease
VSFLGIALGLLILAIVIFAIDLMIPSGGVLVAVTGFLAIGAVVFAFRYSFQAGMAMLVATFALIPILLWVFVVVWPKTPMGKRMIVEPTPAGKFVWSDAAKTGSGEELIGLIGTAACDLLPSGYVKINDQSYEAMSETGPIDNGKPVKVTRLDLGRLVVRESKELPKPTVMSEGTGLDRPATDLNIESLEG